MKRIELHAGRFITGQFHGHARRGAVLLVGLLALLIVSALSAALLKRVMLQRQEIQQAEWKLQADWLAESGLGRGVARRTSDPGYPGETWEIPAAMLDGFHSGRVTIAVTSDEKAKDRMTIEALADYPDDSVHRVRSRKKISVPVSESRSNNSQL